MLLQTLVMNLFNWLPAGLYIPVAAVIAVAFLAMAIKLLLVVFDFLFKFLDLFH